MSEPLFKVESWDEGEVRVVELLATAATLKIARAAFDTAVRQYPNVPITLRIGIRVVARAP